MSWLEKESSSAYAHAQPELILSRIDHFNSNDCISLRLANSPMCGEEKNHKKHRIVGLTACAKVDNQSFACPRSDEELSMHRWNFSPEAFMT
jgi:hypothetical protein